MDKKELLIRIKYALRFIPDEKYVKLYYLLKFKKRLNLNNPKTFNEKLQWLKFNDRNPLYSKLVDKAEVKEYIKEKIGEEYIIPTYGIWNNFDDIDFEKLPNQFVLKCTHDSGGIVICKDKDNLNKKKAKKKLERCLKRNFYYIGREWPYKCIKPRIIAEEYLEDESKIELKDYKVLCFGGSAKLIEVHSGRFGDLYTQDFYDINWKKTNISQGPISDHTLEKPKNFDKMIELSELLAKDMRHVRVDWYNVGEKLFFSEITLYDGSGFIGFDNKKHDDLLGEWICIV